MILNTEDFAENMIGTLPKFYLAEDLKYDNVLQKYLMSAFIGGSDDILKSINGVRNFSDPLKCPSEDLPTLCESWGITYDPSIPEMYQRKQLAYIGELYKRKGTFSCIKYLVRTVTGLDCDLMYSKDLQTGERKFDVVLIAQSIQDITTGKVQKDTYAIQRIVPRFLPFYLIPEVHYSSPRNPIPTPMKYIGERLSQYTRSDLTPNKQPINQFSNPDFSSGTDFWVEEGTDLSLSTIPIVGSSDLALRYIPRAGGNLNGLYQDIEVIYGDKLNLSFKFMSPIGGTTVKLLYTFYRKDNSVIHSILSDSLDLSIRNLWKKLKRVLYVSNKSCTRIRVRIYSDTPNVEIQMTSPIAYIGCDYSLVNVPNPKVLSKVPDVSSISLSWEEVKGASGYRVYYRVYGDSQWLFEDTISVSYTLMYLSGNKKYEIAVGTRTANGFNKIQESDIFSLTTL